jgi:magnesium transporter
MPPAPPFRLPEESSDTRSAWRGSAETIEGRILADTSPRASIEKLHALERKLMVVKHAVGPLVESVSNLSGARVPGVCNDMQHHFRDSCDHLLRLHQMLETARETVSTATG